MILDEANEENTNESKASPQEHPRLEEALSKSEHPYSIRDQDPDFRDAIDFTQLAHNALFPSFGPKRVEKDQSNQTLDPE